MKMKTIAFLLLITSANFVFSQVKIDSTSNTSLPKDSKWYDKIAIRGYLQARYNRLLETNPDLKCEQCDRSMGENGGFLIRRMRIIFSGQISKRVYFYIQPDFASSVGTSGNIAQLRDAYMDLGLDANNEFRIRVGQSKVPYGFENMQSSQNRLPLDRNDALNSSVSNERDMGAFFYWAPKATRTLYADLVKDGLKGSGDYGVFAFGVYNGQTANQTEKNDNLHIVSRLSYPIKIKNQIIEPGIQAYTGKYVLLSTSKDVKKVANLEYLDQRVAASFILYPKPFGIQAEYNVGRGPEFNKLTDSIEVRNLQGGYITLSYLFKAKDQVFIPFARLQYYKGGKKHELDARSYEVNELELGIEWQPSKYFELVAMYTMSQRRFEDYTVKDNFQKGNLLRLQAQINF
jgi:phosphate-selective porin